MFPLVRSLTVRYLIQRWERGLLVALSIALGVATLVSARLLNQYVEMAALDSTVPADVADLYIWNGEIGVQASLVDELKQAKLQGVKRVEPILIDRIALPELNERSAILFGINLEARTEEEQAQANKLKVQLTPINPLAVLGRPVAISRKLYEARKAAGKQDTDPVEIRYTNSIEQFQLFGVIDIPKDSPIAPFADLLVAMEVKQASRFTRRPNADPNDASAGRLTRIDLFLEEGADTAAIHAQVLALVKDRAGVRTPEENRKSTEEVIGGIKIILNLCSLGALIVGLFLVYNALSVTVAERRHDIGVLRSLGATRPQIAWLFTVEAMILGALGALPGIPLGDWMANFALNTFGDELTSIFLSGDIPRPHVSWPTALVAIAAGSLTALAAALIPALQAASDEPADAVRRAPGSAKGIVKWLHRGGCVALILLGMGIIAVRGYLPSRVGSMFGMTCILTGMFLAMPIFLAVFARLLLPIVRLTLGVEARLAADNLVRAPGRTGVVVGALAAGVGLMFQTAGVGISNEVPIREWLDRVIRADAFVFWGNLASANNSMTPMDPKVRTKLQAVPGVEHVVGLRFYRPEFRGTFILMLAMDAEDYRRGVRAQIPDGMPTLDLFERLPQGNYTIVSDNFALKWKVKVGDTIAIPGPRGPVELEVIGIGPDYSWAQGTIFVDRSRYRELFDDGLVDACHVFFRRDADYTTTFEAVKEVAHREQLLVQDRPAVQLYLAGVIDRLFQVAYLQQAIIALVAALGVLTALLISVLQRRRELGLLRAVGATQWQILKTVIAEATLMGVLGTLLGFVIGIPLEWYLLDVVLREESGFVFPMLIPWKAVLGIGLGSIAMATLAGLLPALHAGRMRIPDAIAYE